MLGPATLTDFLCCISSVIYVPWGMGLQCVKHIAGIFLCD